MRVTGVIWLRDVVDKISWKHHVTTDEVEEAINRSPRYRFIETGDVDGEDLYAALGRTEAGRYLSVFFIHKATGEALVISARDMNKNERKFYGKQKKS
ncbi:MAG: BrnT family toxin [bacterium]